MQNHIMQVIMIMLIMHIMQKHIMHIINNAKSYNARNNDYAYNEYNPSARYAYNI